MGVIAEPERDESIASGACFFCNQKRKKYRGNEQSLHTRTSKKTIDELLDIAREQNDILTIDRLQKVTASEGYFLYHNACHLAYRTKSDSARRSTQNKTEWHHNRDLHKLAFKTVQEYVKDHIVCKKECCLLSYLVILYEENVKANNQEIPIRIKSWRLKTKLLEIFRHEIEIEVFNEKEVVQPLGSILLNSDFDRLQEDNILNEAALVIKSILRTVKVHKLPADIRPEDIIAGECETPERLIDFFDKIFEPMNTRRKIASKRRVSESLAQDVIFAASNGRIKPSKHITLAQTLKSITNSQKAVNIVNRYGHCVSDNVLAGIITEATYCAVKKSTICPEGILRNPALRTCLAFDNFDRFVQTLTGKDTLHDTVGIIYQDIPSSANIVTTATAEENQQLTNDGDRKRRRRTFDMITFELESYAKKPRLEVSLEPVASTLRISNDEHDLTPFKHISFTWILSHLLKLPKTPMWIGYYSMLYDDKSSQQKVSYTTTINESPTKPVVVLKTLDISEQTRIECNQQYMEVTYDLAIAKIAFQLQYVERPRFDKIFIHLGTFHVYLAYLKAVGKFIDDCGVTNILVNSNAIASGSVSSFLTSKNYNRCRRLHPRLALAIQILHMERFLEDQNIEISDEEKNALLNFRSTVSSRPTITEEKLISLFSKYDKYSEETLEGRYGLTPQYYMLYVKLANYYLILDQSVRTADFCTFKWVLPRITNMFFTFNQQNYSRYLVYYHEKLMKVEESHPGLLTSFEEGSIGVRRTNKSFSRIPPDLTMEQTSNADAGNKLTGVSYITNSYSARQRWALCHTINSTVNTYTYERTGLKKNQDITEDLRASLMRKNLKSLYEIIENIKDNVNPFATDLNKDLLYNISTGRAVENDVAKFLINVEKLGSEQRERFIQECSEDRTRFERPIKQNKILNFSSVVPKKKCSISGKLVEVRMERDLFGQLLRISLEKKLDIDKILSHPLTPMSLCFSHVDGTLCKTDKSTLLKELEKQIQSDSPPYCDVMIFDGFFLLNAMKDVPRTFGNVSKKFLQMVTSNTASTIIVLFDSYPSPSIKDSAHQCRGTSRGQQFKIRGPDQVRPLEFTREMRNINFKEELINFFSNHWGYDEMASFINSKEVYISADECHKYSVVHDKVCKTTLQSLACPGHEEADTKIVFHICQLDDDKNVVVRTSDSDIPIIVLGNMHNFKNKVRVWIKLGTGNRERFLNVNQLYSALGKNVCRALPSFHAFSGCDYNPAFFKKGKVRPFSILKRSPEFLKAFYDMNTDNADEIFATIEKFVCAMYGFKSIDKVNDGRVAMFMKIYKFSEEENRLQLPNKNFDGSLLPPSQSELTQHLRRTILISNIWKNAFKKEPPNLDPLEYGWQFEDGKFVCKWFEGDQLPSSVEMITQEDTNAEGTYSNYY